MIVISFAGLSSCASEDPITVLLNPFSKTLMPVGTAIPYAAADGSSGSLVLDDSETYFENTVYETSPTLFGKTELYADQENIVRKYTSEDIDITYHLSAVASNAGVYNDLDITIESAGGLAETSVTLPTLEQGEVTEDLVFMDSVVFGGTTLYDIFQYDHGGRDYYFRIPLGLTGFTHDGQEWVLY